MNENIYCPISQQIFYEPVIAKDGRVYEKQLIVEWLRQHGTSPMTRAEINDEVVPVIFLKNYIEEYIEKHSKLKDQVFKPEYEHPIFEKEVDNIIESGAFYRLKKYVNFDFNLFSDKGVSKLFDECTDDSVLKHIIDNTIDLENKDYEGWRPIHVVCRFSKPVIIKYLIRKGVDLECKNDKGYRPIHLILLNSTPGIIKYIVNKGVKLNCQNNYDGGTPKDILLKQRSKRTICNVIKHFSMEKDDIKLLLENDKIKSVKAIHDILACCE